MNVPDTSICAITATSAKRIETNGKERAVQGKRRNWE